MLASRPATMRIWFDMTASAHPLVLRPVIERLQTAGHEVEVTARDYGQTLEIVERLGLPYTAVGRHAGASMARKALALGDRTLRLARWSRKRFDLAVAHGSNDLALAAALNRIPALNTFDYEWARQQHNIGCRLARRVMVPEAIPPERLRQYGVDGRKLAQYPGLKEEYYLADFKADDAVLAELGVDPARIIVVMRPPPEVSMYHRHENPLFPRVLEALGRREDVHAVVIPRVEEQRRFVEGLRLPSVIMPRRAIDAQSLIALADLVVSAGGTMNREAVALGTPVYTTFGGRLGGVDEWLMREGRLRPLRDPAELEVTKLPAGERTVLRRDPDVMVDLVLGTLEG
jgi:predicted glycosyltransferase